MLTYSLIKKEVSKINQSIPYFTRYNLTLEEQQRYKTTDYCFSNREEFSLLDWSHLLFWIQEQDNSRIETNKTRSNRRAMDDAVSELKVTFDTFTTMYQALESNLKVVQQEGKAITASQQLSKATAEQLAAYDTFIKCYEDFKTAYSLLCKTLRVVKHDILQYIADKEEASPSSLSPPPAIPVTAVPKMPSIGPHDMPIKNLFDALKDDLHQKYNDGEINPKDILEQESHILLIQFIHYVLQDYEKEYPERVKKLVNQVVSTFGGVDMIELAFNMDREKPYGALKSPLGSYLQAELMDFIEALTAKPPTNPQQDSTSTTQKVKDKLNQLKPDVPTSEGNMPNKKSRL